MSFNKEREQTPWGTAYAMPLPKGKGGMGVIPYGQLQVRVDLEGNRLCGSGVCQLPAHAEVLCRFYTGDGVYAPYYQVDGTPLISMVDLATLDRTVIIATTEAYIHTLARLDNEQSKQDGGVNEQRRRSIALAFNISVDTLLHVFEDIEENERILQQLIRLTNEHPELIIKMEIIEWKCDGSPISLANIMSIIQNLRGLRQGMLSTQVPRRFLISLDDIESFNDDRLQIMYAGLADEVKVTQTVVQGTIDNKEDSTKLITAILDNSSVQYVVLERVTEDEVRSFCALFGQSFSNKQVMVQSFEYAYPLPIEVYLSLVENLPVPEYCTHHQMGRAIVVS